VVFHIGAYATRYGAYRDHPRRQRCLAHLIRKALALAEGSRGIAPTASTTAAAGLSSTFDSIQLPRSARACYRSLEFFTAQKSQAIGGNHGPHH